MKVRMTLEREVKVKVWEEERVVEGGSHETTLTLSIPPDFPSTYISPTHPTGIDLIHVLQARMECVCDGERFEVVEERQVTAWWGVEEVEEVGRMRWEVEGREVWVSWPRVVGFGRGEIWVLVEGVEGGGGVGGELVETHWIG
ncbi:hypothetical protein HDU67_010331 [Dinochytrium kinnereticum]|nr:hypothetical protein HDU67_010331 [Dinochytrium kinnereticum]